MTIGRQDRGTGPNYSRLSNKPSELIERAKTLDEEVSRMHANWSRRRARGSSACQIKDKLDLLNRIYQRLNNLMTRGFTDERGIPVIEGPDGLALEESPLAGTIMDIAPFSKKDIWASMSAEVAGFCFRQQDTPSPPTDPDPIPTDPDPIPTGPDPRDAPDLWIVLDEKTRPFFSSVYLRDFTGTTDRPTGEDVAPLMNLNLYLMNLISGSPFVCSDDGNLNGRSRAIALLAQRHLSAARREFRGTNRPDSPRSDEIFAWVINRYRGAWWNRYSNEPREIQVRERQLRRFASGSGSYCGLHATPIPVN